MSCLRIASRAARAQDSFRFRVSYDLSLGADTAPLFFMSTFQERILAASGSSSSTADTDPELYRYRSASSEEYLESCNYRVWSTELPDRFLVWWMCPVGRDEAEQRSLERELRSDEESPLHIPLEIFMTAYYERYERVKGMASFLSDDCAVGSEDAAAAVEAQLAGDADYRAQAFAFIEGFVCFQQSFSRHGIARASAALPIWLSENVGLSFEQVGRGVIRPGCPTFGSEIHAVVHSSGFVFLKVLGLVVYGRFSASA